MNEKMAVWSFLWFGADPRSTLSADSQWFPRLVLTPSKAQVLTPRSHLFILLLFQFCFGSLASYLVSEQTPICLKHHHSQSKTKKKKNSVEPPSQPIRNLNHRCFLPLLQKTPQNPAGITLCLHHLATVKIPCFASHQSIVTHKQPPQVTTLPPPKSTNPSPTVLLSYTEIPNPRH